MLANIIDWSGRNRFLVLLATLFVITAGASLPCCDADRRPARPLGRAGHRLHRSTRARRRRWWRTRSPTR
jgi:hypothetical protein